ncbi:hypothetical protein [Sphingobacterium sp. SYP-B4668]|uniref:hypothetical protein n=1 Tax=Sphingobacterium sp. SYP-B4668 TaxID=2996035 RepID=UPI0022DCF7DC|nr:hypothetical protein [Sphingobacterium sp. SYP-B4668]
MKMKMMYAMVLAFVMVAFVGCSKDDDGPSGGSIDAAVGTYKGTIDIVGGGQKFNQTVVVTKVSDKKVRITAQDGSLKLPVKEMEVYNNSNMGILSQPTEPQGVFVYTFENKGLSFVTKVTAEGEVMYSFEGLKQ